MKKILLIAGAVIVLIIVLAIASNPGEMSNSFQDGMDAGKNTVEELENNN